MTSVSEVDWKIEPRFLQHGLQRQRVGEVAVVRDGEAAARKFREQRLDVARAAAAVRGVADMADGAVAGQPVHHGSFGKGVADKADVALRMEAVAIEGDDAARFLAAMLQGVQAEGGERAGAGMAEHAEYAALLAQLVVVERVGRHVVHGRIFQGRRRRQLPLFWISVSRFCRVSVPYVVSGGGFAAPLSSAGGRIGAVGRRVRVVVAEAFQERRLDIVRQRRHQLLAEVGKQRLRARIGDPRGRRLHQPREEEQRDDQEQNAARRAEKEAKPAIERADAAVDDEIGNLGGDIARHDERHEEDDRRRDDRRHRAALDVGLHHRHQRLVEEIGRGDRGQP